MSDPTSAVSPTSSASALPPGLADYFLARERSRAARVEEMLAVLSSRELALVREAAVMGWVRGTQNHAAPIPRDSHILRDVPSAADAFDDLYPMLSALGRPEEPESDEVAAL